MANDALDPNVVGSNVIHLTDGAENNLLTIIYLHLHLFIYPYIHIKSYINI